VGKHRAPVKGRKKGAARGRLIFGRRPVECTRLFLIRHGNTADEETKKVYKGKIDIPLSRAGVTRMHGAAAFLSTYTLNRVYTSTLSRSMDSGRIVAEGRGLDIEPDPAFDEVGFGVWEGLSFDEIRERYPEDLSRWLRDPASYPPPQGESFGDARARSMARLKEILAAERASNIGIVAHAGILRIMIFSLLAMRLTRLFRLGQGYGCINIVDVYEDGNVVLDLLNFTQYSLPAE
jgi:alpha-ribazole phosphatase